MLDLPPPLGNPAKFMWVADPDVQPPTLSVDQPWPRITVVTPSYNQGTYLEETIRSVLLQSYPNLEFFVMDGGSSDESVTIIKHYAQWIDYWKSAPDRGQSQVVNDGFARGTGTIHAWLNSDDFYLPGTLRFIGEQFMANPDLHFLAGDALYVDENSRPFPPKPRSGPSRRERRPITKDGHRYYPNLEGPAVFWTNSMWESVGGLEEELHYAMDRKFWLFAMEQGYRPVYVPDKLVGYRYHPTSKGVAGVDKFFRAMADMHFEIAGKGNFTWLPNLLIGWHFFTSAMTNRCDLRIAQGKPLQAAFWLTLAMLLNPGFIRRRLYSWRQIAQAIWQ